MAIQYNNLILVILNEEQLRSYQEKYYTSDNVTIFDIARQMKTEAQDVIDSFDFLDFAEALMRQADGTFSKATTYSFGDGVLAREHLVTVVSLDDRGKRTNAVPRLYGDAKTTPLAVRVNRDAAVLQIQVSKLK